MIKVIIILIYVLLILLISEKLKSNNKEIPRKFVHIMTSNVWILYMMFFSDSSYVPIVTSFILFVLTLLIHNFKLFDSIKEERGYGTMYFALSYLILSYLCYAKLHDPRLGLISVMIMGYSDGFASLIGKGAKKFNSYWIRNKSVIGSMTFFIFTCVILVLNNCIFQLELTTLHIFVLSVYATLLESVSTKGLDNLFVPLGVYLMMLAII